MSRFVHLHVHSQYSILDGQASIPRLVDKAMADGQPGLAVTDHGNMFGIKEFFNYDVRDVEVGRSSRLTPTSRRFIESAAFFRLIGDSIPHG